MSERWRRLKQLPWSRRLLGWSTRPGCIQIVLAVSAVLYLASVGLIPQLNPIIGLLVVIWLAVAGGIYVFILSLAPARPVSRTAGPPAQAPAGRQLPTAPSGVAPTPAAAADPLSDTGPNPTLTRKPRPLKTLPATAPLKSAAARRRTGPASINTAPLRQSPRQRMAWLRRARRAAHHAGDLPAEADYLLELSAALWRAGAPARASVCSQRALAIARRTGDQRAQALALDNIGLLCAELGQTRPAVEYAEQHVRLMRALRDRAGAARASWNLGLAYAELGRLEPAIGAMQVCVDYERAVDHPDAATDAALVQQLQARLASEPPEGTMPPASPER